MIEALRVMTYFKISLPTRNWDIAFFMGLQRGCGLFFQFTQPIGSDGIGFRHSLGCGCNLLGWER